jgi:D-beta-D-heptose 7-phosphate kinase/D-beta-D-heptose 1-phosphate adenosyltransferase
MGAPISRDPEALRAAAARWRAQGERVVTTNGCFDILHAGHIRTLLAASELGGRVVVGLNSDDSVRRLKGADRPVVSESVRAQTLAALPFVDWVQIFDGATVDEVIEAARPDVHVKGGDYEARELPEHRLVESLGGRVEIVPELEDLHTSELLARYRSRSS